ncbi:hypothetical protein BDV96DRAFT_158517 [Lophiotrema nucula]|uniref:Uncharacterized protein n=1 Tax=Lophiotrema nucula TaxID=690887 RepID=A0A6A5YZT1_9PLEO|nr:hypothetical protein BDV96DRAFT_158517 [Lophiotrema nucula]
MDGFAWATWMGWKWVVAMFGVCWLVWKRCWMDVVASGDHDDDFLAGECNFCTWNEWIADASAKHQPRRTSTLGSIDEYNPVPILTSRVRRLGNPLRSTRRCCLRPIWQQNVIPLDEI